MTLLLPSPSSVINGHSLHSIGRPVYASGRSVLIPQTSFSQLCYFPSIPSTPIFPGCTLACLPPSLLRKGYLMPSHTRHLSCIYNRQKFAATWISGVKPPEKQVRWMKIMCTSHDTLAASIWSCLYPLLLIIPQTSHNKTELGAKVLQWARKCSLWRGARLPRVCLFSILLQQLSTAKEPKTCARFPCTCRSSHSSLVLTRYSFCLCSPVHMSRTGLSCPRTHRLPSQSLLFSQSDRHSISNTRPSRSKSKVHQWYSNFLHSLKLHRL